jgi:hypothetical protein
MCSMLLDSLYVAVRSQSLAVSYGDVCSKYRAIAVH